ncbi:pyrroline-5-carboxylate reductase [Acidiferrimicrobium sp. IK]|uniref:pyrroline-5-carboxylate reductase n=1 Tax=Acidiferrimicrobium sp. IK TaxID=2871700 RepID=UPI0021CB9515|nr:pyrroline-5-carboxylate reductase [Acidiferrimicrobium sp. IK]MCU4183147.1 pyrroline-5-carboxylate reductase [Acidiferrimicrobium sp. IK]
MGADLVVIGGGRMGEALVGGLLSAGAFSPTSVAVVEPDTARRDVLEARFPGLAVVASVDEMDAAAGFGAVIAVKPGDVTGAARAVAGAGPSRVLSVAAGVTLASLRAAVGAGPALLRAMPNTPALVGAGAAGLAAAEGVAPEDLAWAEGILGAVGLVVVVGEGLLDAVTGLSGSGPAYAFLVAEALIDAGVLVGLPRPVAEALTAQTLLGAARMLAEGTDGPGALRAAVTSPGGTTAAGLRALEDRGVRAALSDAVVAATERSRQLGS